MTPIPEAFSRLDLYTVLHNLADGVTLADAEGRIVFSNAAADRILGASAAVEADPEEWAEHYGVFLPDGQTPFPTERYPLVRAIEGEATRDVEMLVRNGRHPDGVLISVSGQPLVDEEGTLMGATVVFRDITELRKMQRMREELAGFIVHDLKSPLTTIIATASLMADENPHDQELLDDARSISVAASRVSRTVMNLLDTQMAEDGRLELAMSRVQASEILGEVHEAAVARIGVREGDRLVMGDVDGLELRVDRDLLFRALMNLVENCVKYGPGTGKIWLDARRVGPGRIRFTVRDQGPGVPEHLRERIFEKYSRVEREDGFRSRDSRGLGLRFCKVVAEAHGGRIWVEDAESVGARFCLELPVEGTGSHSEADDLLVLVVDDDEDDRLSLGAMLEGAGHRVLTASSGREALESFMDRPLRVVVTDIVMTGGDGVSLISWLRGLDPTIPVVAVSGKGEAGLAAAKGMGADAVLTKPVDPGELTEAVREAAAQRR